MKNIAILGSTGSIGRNALDVIRSLGTDYSATALTSNSNWEMLAQQVEEYHPKRVAIVDGEGGRRLKERLSGNSVQILTGEESIEEIVADANINFVLSAIVGAAALPATLTAIEHKKNLALANKEALVMAGGIVTERARKKGVTLLPVDSEHSAIFQSLSAGRRSELRRVILTASGGAFRDYPVDKLDKVTPEQALDHPTWKMGKKITIDSATLMNKALEIIEAKWLFGLKAEEIDVVIHHQSIIHSMVEFQDGSVIAQMGLPDMKLPIQYALTYPERRPASVEPLDLAKLGKLTFAKPDLQRFPALRLGFWAVNDSGTLPAVMNAANEVAVDAFLERRLKFTGIVRAVEEVMHKHTNKKNPSLEDIMSADSWARKEVRNAIR
ncbi:MAG: 1-deoxy-D-xylulose-5-phosphate reductoisomerase [Planctomycetes bacterium RIFCSPHIGHO2_02_FULL_50_42]|nr:MAG: 1-deoxy-D-xylulose-5-phosphate reductoisomerase [Planctomycetes bacterium RIFCSPHIGHO2_02_FULL_50_42]OHC02792.1 MAG: 1-deoxy-D-xylulose-5-phosphate reductoisomerase [Planctomycetes bacterium RIFCSPLOWO2_12_FULL_50_35]